jgi:hypothetical protein
MSYYLNRRHNQQVVKRANDQCAAKQMQVDRNFGLRHKVSKDIVLDCATDYYLLNGSPDLLYFN